MKHLQAAFSLFLARRGLSGQFPMGQSVRQMGERLFSGHAEKVDGFVQPANDERWSGLKPPNVWAASLSHYAQWESWL